jgi:hypothetical protein
MYKKENDHKRQIEAYTDIETCTGKREHWTIFSAGTASTVSMLFSPPLSIPAYHPLQAKQPPIHDWLLSVQTAPFSGGSARHIPAIGLSFPGIVPCQHYNSDLTTATNLLYVIDWCLILRHKRDHSSITAYILRPRLVMLATFQVLKPPPKNCFPSGKTP